MTKPWKEWTDEELADEAQTGTRGQGAVVEATRRLREAVVKQQMSANWLTVALVVFAVIQTLVFIVPMFRR